MVKINRIYTKTGDDGKTGLVDGSRISKNSARVKTYGEVDELMSWIGWVRTYATTSQRKNLEDRLKIIQSELFDIGSILASPAGASWPSMPTISKEQVTRLESWIDAITDSIPELRSFVLPGGNELNSALHVARAVCRRAEREIVALKEEEHVPTEILIYVNRLSDLLFAMAREESHAAGIPEYLWEPGSTKI